MATYIELQEQIKALQAQADLLKAQELPSVIADIKAKIAEYGITVEQIFDHVHKSSPTEIHTPSGRRQKLPMKYDFAGEQWSGRGKMPKAMQAEIDAGRAKSKDDFLIKK